MTLKTDGHEYELIEIEYVEYVTYNKILPDEILSKPQPLFEEERMRYIYKALRFNNKFYGLKLIQ